MKFSPRNKTGVFIISYPKLFFDTLLLAKNYKEIYVILNFSKQHSKKLITTCKKLLKEKYPSINFIELNLNFCFSTNRKESIKEANLRLEELKRVIYFKKTDIFCNPNGCPISLIISSEVKIFIVQHEAIEILNHFFPIIRKFYNFYKYRLPYKGAYGVVGCLKIKKFFHHFINYYCVWDQMEISEKESKELSILLWPPSTITTPSLWGKIPTDQIDLTNNMIKTFKKVSAYDKNNIYIKFHPRQLAQLNDTQIDNALKLINKNNVQCINIKKLNKNTNFDYMPIELIYYLKRPYRMSTIDIGSTASWNLACLENVEVFTIQFDLSTYLIKAITKRALIARILLFFVVKNYPNSIMLKRSKDNT